MSSLMSDKLILTIFVNTFSAKACVHPPILQSTNPPYLSRTCGVHEHLAAYAYIGVVRAS